LLNKEAVKRAANFPRMIGRERAAYWIYQFSTVAIFICLFFVKIILEPSWLFYIGLIVYMLGLAVCALSVINFAKPSGSGMSSGGLYRFSRNPMYASYFIFFISCVLITRSLVLLVFVLLFQIATHWIILSEERWCVNEFGEEYTRYIKRVRRYI